MMTAVGAERTWRPGLFPRSFLGGLLEVTTFQEPGLEFRAQIQVGKRSAQ